MIAFWLSLFVLVLVIAWSKLRRIGAFDCNSNTIFSHPKSSILLDWPCRAELVPSEHIPFNSLLMAMRVYFKVVESLVHSLAMAFRLPLPTALPICFLDDVNKYDNCLCVRLHFLNALVPLEYLSYPTPHESSIDSWPLHAWRECSTLDLGGSAVA